MRIGLNVAAIAAALLVGCGQTTTSVNGAQVPISFRVFDVNSEKTEKFVEYSKRTDIMYVTKGAIELVTPNAEKRPMLVYLLVTDVNGFGEGGTVPQRLSVPVHEGRGIFKLRESRSIAVGQAHPGAPRYEFDVIGYESFLPGKLVSGDEGSGGEATSDGVLAFELRQDAVRLVESQPSYGGTLYWSKMAGSLRLKDPTLQATPYVVNLRLIAESHPDEKKIGEVGYEAVHVFNGQGSFDTAEYFSEKPSALPKFKVEIFGAKKLSSAALAK